MDVAVTSSFLPADVGPSAELKLAWQGLAEFGVSTPDGLEMSDYFIALNAVLIATNEVENSEAVEAVMAYINCLADEAGCSPASILTGNHFTADPKVISQTLAGISDVMQVASMLRREQAVAARHSVAAPALEPALQSALTTACRTLLGFGIRLPSSASPSTYFKHLHEPMKRLNQYGKNAVVPEIMAHVDYLAEKAGCGAAVILAGGDFIAEPTIILDSIINIDNLLQATLANSLSNTPASTIELTPDANAAPSNVSPAIEDALSVAHLTLSSFNVPITQATGLSDYFKSLNDVLTALKLSGRSAWAEEAIRHIDYLADKAGCERAAIAEVDQTSIDQQYILEAVGNIDAVLRAAPAKQPEPPFGDIPDDISALILETEATLADWTSRETALVLARTVLQERQQVILKAVDNIDGLLRMAPGKPREPRPVDIPDDVFALILEAEATLAGWCSREKALVIVGTVLRERPAICVEIGVFGGRSLLPCAAALRHIGAGVIYGIEAWSPDIAIEHVTNEVNDEWWSKVDFAGVKREFYRFVAAANLTRQVRIIEAPSGRAAALFDRIDFLHIDGSHSMVNATEDVILYARKVRSGGIIVFDDVNWQSTAPAREILAALCDTVTVLKDPASGLDVCAVMRRC